MDSRKVTSNRIPSRHTRAHTHPYPSHTLGTLDQSPGPPEQFTDTQHTHSYFASTSPAVQTATHTHIHTHSPPLHSECLWGTTQGRRLFPDPPSRCAPSAPGTPQPLPPLGALARPLLSLGAASPPSAPLCPHAVSLLSCSPQSLSPQTLKFLLLISHFQGLFRLSVSPASFSIFLSLNLSLSYSPHLCGEPLTPRASLLDALTLSAL